MPPGLVKVFFNSEQKHTNGLVKKEQILDFSKRYKERRSNYLCPKLFLANVPIMVNIWNNSAVY